MRFLRIIFLHFESVFEHRLRSFVWFLSSMINPLMIILFWAGAQVGNKEIHPNWSTANINSYYFLLMIASALLMSHIEEDVSFYDIRQGDLAKYLVKPFPYYWLKFIEETPYRVLQGVYGVIAISIMSILFKNFIQITLNPQIILIGLICGILAFFISFTYKMCLGLLAFWLKEIRGITQLLEILAIIFAGYILPIEMLPASLKTIAYFLPFSYIIYFPVKIFQGGLVSFDFIKIISGQVIWLIIFILINRLEWKQGIKTFTAIGR